MSLRKAVVDLTLAVATFDRAVALGADEATWQEAALLLRHARTQVQLLQAAVGAIEARVIVARRAEGISGDVPVQGVGVVSVHRPRNRKAWDHDGLAGHVLDRHLSDLGGDLPPPWDVARWLTDAAHIDYWRVGILRDLGIDVDQFCSSEPGVPTVAIVSSSAPPEAL